MDLRNLRVFIEVAELNSFTRAGEKLGYSQPTVSFQIKQLEQELGVPLFDRIGHTVSLTDAGHRVLAYAQDICRLSQEMAQGANRQPEISGMVRLGMADSLCSPLIENGFAAFRAAYPGVALRIFTAGTGELFRLLDHHEVDMVCTLDNHIYNTDYVIASEEKVDVHFVAAAGHPLAGRTVQPAELTAFPFLLTEKGMSYRRMLDEWLARESMEIHPMLETGRADVICRLVEADVGISFLPDYVTAQARRAGRLLQLQVEGCRIELWKQLLYRRDKWMSPQMRAMIGHLSGIALVETETPGGDAAFSKTM